MSLYSGSLQVVDDSSTLKRIQNTFTVAGRTNYISKMRDVALLGSRWPSGAQQLGQHGAPRGIVLLNPSNFEDVLEACIEAYGDGEKQAIATADLDKYPSVVCIDWSSKSIPAEMLDSQDFATFVRCCGKFITEMWIFNCNFGSFPAFVQLMRGFPHLFTLRMSDCVWNVSTMRQARIKYPQIAACCVPSLLDTLSISVKDPFDEESIYDLPAVTSWINQQPSDSLRSVILDASFAFTESHEEAIRYVLHTLGTALIDVSFNLAKCPPELLDVTLYPDLSANTRLMGLTFDRLASDLITPSYLLSTLASVTSPALEWLTLIADILDPEDADFTFLGLDPVIEHLAYADNFPSLKVVRLIIVNQIEYECPRGKALWRFIHERFTPLRQKGVQIKCRLECPDDMNDEDVDFYCSVSYEEGEYDTEMAEGDLYRAPFLLRSCND